MGKPKKKRFSRDNKRGDQKKYFKMPLIFKNQEAREKYIIKRMNQIRDIIADSVLVLSQERSGILKITYSLKDIGTYQEGFRPHVFSIEIYEKKHSTAIHPIESFLKNVIIVERIAIHNALFKTINEIVHTKIKGMKSETRVQRILLNLKDQNILKHDILIKDIMPAGLYSEINGIDMHIIAMSSTATVFVPLQIKSSKTGQDEHIEKYVNIPSIHINGKTDEQIRDAIFLICYTYIHGSKKNHQNILNL